MTLTTYLLYLAAVELAVLTGCVSRIAPLPRSSRPGYWANRTYGGLFMLMGTLLLFARRNA